MGEQWGVDISALRAEFNRQVVTRMHFHPGDLDALWTHVDHTVDVANDELIFPVGSIECRVGHPIRPGLVRAERSDGTFFLIPLTKMPPFCDGCMCWRDRLGDLVQNHCRPCGFGL